MNELRVYGVAHIEVYIFISIAVLSYTSVSAWQHRITVHQYNNKKYSYIDVFIQDINIS